MVQAIVYSSNTGFSKQFAYSLAVKTNIQIFDLKEAKKKLPKGANIIYFSWVNAGKINNIKKIKDYNVIYYAVCGLSSYNEEMIKKLKEDNNVSNIYYLEGGIRYRYLNLFQRFIMNMIRKSLKKKSKKQELSSDEAILLQKLEYGYESINLDSLDILIKYIEESSNYIS